MNIEIIKAPVITEKTNNLASANVYVFKVDKSANKTEIKQAIENKWNVKVLSVNTTNTQARKSWKVHRLHNSLQKSLCKT